MALSLPEQRLPHPREFVPFGQLVQPAVRSTACLRNVRWLTTLALASVVVIGICEASVRLGL